MEQGDNAHDSVDGVSASKMMCFGLESSVSSPDGSLPAAATTVTGRYDFAPLHEASITARPTQYSMQHARRGKFIIIDNEEFEPRTGADVRTGTKVDSERLKKVFTGLGFDVAVERNQTASQMLELMKTAAADTSHSDCDCFGVAVLTHGTSNKYDILYGVDNIVSVNDFVDPIKDCKSLVGKPKLFFFQACRGVKFMPGKEAEPEDEVEGGPFAAPKLIPREADFLYAHSTPPDYYAWRNNQIGSCFIQALCDQLESLANRKLDLVRILTRVNDQVCDFKSNCPTKPYMDGMMQVPSIVSMLTKDLFFY